MNSLSNQCTMFAPLQQQQQHLAKKRSRNVSFSQDGNTVHQLEAAHAQNPDVQADEQCLWYNRNDYKTFRMNAEEETKRFLVREIESGIPSKANDPTLQMRMMKATATELRGLEQLVDRLTTSQRRRQKLRAIKSVLIAQSLAWDQKKQHAHIDVEKFIAGVAMEQTASAQKLAVFLARDTDHNLATSTRRRSIRASRIRRLSSAAA